MVQTLDRRRFREHRGCRRPGSARASAAGLLLFAGLALGGCTDGDELLQPISARCLPGKAPPASPSASESPSGRVDVYFDVSGSATNFGTVESESFYKDLIDWLLSDSLSDTSSMSHETRMFGFADSIAEIDANTLIAAVRRGRRERRQPICPRCGQDESRLDRVLREVADEASGSLALVITDLWLHNSTSAGRPQLLLRNPVELILRDGRAIGLLGVATPYSGVIYDVPGAPPDWAPPSVEQLPFFVLADWRTPGGRPLQGRDR